MTPEESTLVELAFRFAPTWKGEREVGRLYHRLRAYLENTGELPNIKICQYNARLTRYDVIRKDLSQRHRQDRLAKGGPIFSFYSLDHPDCPRDDLEARYPGLRSRESSPADSCTESLMEQVHMILYDTPSPLTPRDWKVANDYFLLGRTLREIGHDLRLSTSRICQILKRIAPEIRRRLEKLNATPTSEPPEKRELTPEEREILKRHEQAMAVDPLERYFTRRGYRRRP